MVEWVQKLKRILVGDGLHRPCQKLNLQVSYYPKTLVQQASTLRSQTSPKALFLTDQNTYSLSQRGDKSIPQNQHAFVDLEKGFLWDIPGMPCCQCRVLLHADNGNSKRAASLQTRQYTGKRTR